MYNFETDNTDYQVLEHAVDQIKGINGLICEIGVRLGGATKIMIDAMLKNGDNKVVIGIDCYGEIPYMGTEKTHHIGHYDNKMRRKFLKNICEFCEEKEVDYVFFNLEDFEFFSRFGDGVPIYDKKKTIINQYSLVFIDGPHCLESVKRATEFFIPRTVIGSILVYDDVGVFDFDTITKILLENGFERFEDAGPKSAWKRVK